MNSQTLQRLIEGQVLVDYREGGNSMVPIIASRQPITIHPVDPALVEVGDVVISRVHGRIFCHLISAIDNDRVQISNNRGHVNGWTSRSKVYGIVTHVEGVERPGTMKKVKNA